MTQLAFHFDGTRCTECKTCMMACKDYKDLSIGSTYRNVYEITGGSTLKDEAGIIITTCVSYPLSMACNHCSKPACVDVCPTGAMHREADLGLVLINEDVCIGCGYCHMACPYNAPKIDRERGHSVKCDGCYDRVINGEKPVCVEACPARALDFGEANELADRGWQADIAPLPDPAYTSPNLYIKEPQDARPSRAAEMNVSNPMEVQ